MVRRYRILLFVFVVIVGDQAAALVPVIDAKAIIGTIRNIQAIEKMKNLAHGDMEKLRGEFNALNPLGFKNDNLSSHTWSAGSWKSALSGVDNVENFKKENSDIYQFSNQSSQQPEIESTLKTNSVLETESEEEYNRLGTYTKAINELSNKVQITANTKSALDINNKLLVEIAYLEVEMIHMQVISNQAASWRIHHDLKLAASADKFLGDVGGKK